MSRGQFVYDTFNALRVTHFGIELRLRFKLILNSQIIFLLPPTDQMEPEKDNVSLRTTCFLHSTHVFKRQAFQGGFKNAFHNFSYIAAFWFSSVIGGCSNSRWQWKFPFDCTVTEKLSQRDMKLRNTLNINKRFQNMPHALIAAIGRKLWVGEMCENSWALVLVKLDLIIFSFIHIVMHDEVKRKRKNSVTRCTSERLEMTDSNSN